jgi:outer membrane lipoprotein-sorting protein
MSNRPASAARYGAAMLWSVSIAASALLLASSPYPASAAGDDAPGVLTKMAGVYSNAKSFQATITSKEAGKTPDGKAFTVTATQEIRYKAPNMVYMSMRQSGTGAAAGKKPDGTPMLDSGRVVINSDGKTLVIYSETKNQYVKQNALPAIPLTEAFALLKRLPGPKSPGLSMASSTTVGGRAAYVIQAKPVMPPNLSPADQKKWQDAAAKAQPLKLMIDKQNYQLLSLSESAAGGSLDISFGSQAVNGNIAANAFSFAPPAGSKEAPKPQGQPGGGGGIPGLPK